MNIVQNFSSPPNATSSSANDGGSMSYAIPVYDGFLIVLSVLIIAINLLVIMLFFYREYLQTKTNSLLISLAVSDLMVGLLGIPLTVACNWVLQIGVCVPAALIYRFIATSTMYHILVITLERYIYVMYPMKYINIVTGARVLKTIAGVWLFSLLNALIQLAWEDPSKFFTKDPVAERYAIGYTIYSLIFCFFLPALFMAVSYVRMFVVIHHQSKQIRGQYSTRAAASTNQRSPIATEARALVIFALMLTVFVLCWLSFYVTGFLIYLVDAQLMPQKPLLVLDFIRFAVAFINPILYAFLKRDFSRALKSLRRRDGVHDESSASSSRLRTITLNFSLSRTSDVYRD